MAGTARWSASKNAVAHTDRRTACARGRNHAVERRHALRALGREFRPSAHVGDRAAVQPSGSRRERPQDGKQRFRFAAVRRHDLHNAGIGRRWLKIARMHGICGGSSYSSYANWVRTANKDDSFRLQLNDRLRVVVA